MTSREMLKLAALAAGYEYRPKDGIIVVDGIPSNWNPLTDAADAQRLAAHLGILLRLDFIRLIGDLLGSGVDHRDAYRLAIVRIAAKIGRHMKEEGQ